jgi:hypothetical protein
MSLDPAIIEEFLRRCPPPEDMTDVLDESDWVAMARVLAAVHRRQVQAAKDISVRRRSS